MYPRPELRLSLYTIAQDWARDLPQRPDRDEVWTLLLGAFWRGTLPTTLPGSADDPRPRLLDAMRRLPPHPGLQVVDTEDVADAVVLHDDGSVSIGLPTIVWPDAPAARTPDARHVLLWAVTLFEDALRLSHPEQQHLQVRDAVIIGLFASRGPRLRTLLEMRPGRHLLRRGGAWELFFERSMMKGKEQELELPNDPRVSVMLERYVTVDRPALTGGQTHDAVWVNRQGGPLAYKGIETMFRERTQQQFGVAFGPHRLRHSLVTTAAVVDGTNALGPALVLGHSPQTALKSYNRARNLEASRQHDARISEAETRSQSIQPKERKQPRR